MMGVRPCRFPYLFQRPSDRARWRPVKYQKIHGATAGIHAALVASRWPTDQPTVSAFPPPIILPSSPITACKHKMWQGEGYSVVRWVSFLRISAATLALSIASADASSALSAEVAGSAGIL